MRASGWLCVTRSRFGFEAAFGEKLVGKKVVEG